MTTRGFELIGVSKSYSLHKALDGLSFRIPPGSHAAILGPSGSGKSTLLRLLAGLEAPTVGSVLLDGEILSENGRVLCPPHQRGMSMVFQDLALWPNLTVEENLRLGLSGLQLTKQDAAERVHEALAMCGISEHAGRLPSQLSGGQQQRTAVARAVAVRPRFLLLDEPFSGVDLALKSRLHDELARLSETQGFQIILVSHDPWEALALCEYAILLDGCLRETGNLQDLLAQSPWEPCLSFRRLQILTRGTGSQ